MKICEAGRDSCGCKEFTKGIRTINGQYPDDNRDFDINAGNGIRIEPATAGITIINDSAASSFVEGDNIEITPSGDDLVIGLVSDPVINGDLQVNGDIIQNGSAYETHAEKIYTTNDYIITRDGAISALSAGDYSGFQVKKYDGTNDGRLVIDNTGTARVGDVGDEQPLLTREESADLSNGDIFTWDSANSKAVGISNNFTQGTGNIGSDTKPVKIVNGVAVEVSNPLNNEYTSNSQTNISLPAGWVTTDLTSVTVDQGRYIIIGQIDFTSGNGEITGGYQNGTSASRWLAQYNNTVSNFNHLNFTYVIDVSSDNTVVKLQAFSQYVRTVERGTLMLISI